MKKGSKLIMGGNECLVRPASDLSSPRRCASKERVVEGG